MKLCKVFAVIKNEDYILEMRCKMKKTNQNIILITLTFAAALVASALTLQVTPALGWRLPDG